MDLFQKSVSVLEWNAAITPLKQRSSPFSDRERVHFATTLLSASHDPRSLDEILASPGILPTLLRPLDQVSSPELNTDEPLRVVHALALAGFRSEAIHTALPPRSVPLPFQLWYLRDLLYRCELMGTCCTGVDYSMDSLLTATGDLQGNRPRNMWPFPFPVFYIIGEEGFDRGRRVLEGLSPSHTSNLVAAPDQFLSEFNLDILKEWLPRPDILSLVSSPDYRSRQAGTHTDYPTMAENLLHLHYENPECGEVLGVLEKSPASVLGLPARWPKPGGGWGKPSDMYRRPLPFGLAMVLAGSTDDQPDEEEEQATLDLVNRSIRAWGGDFAELQRVLTHVDVIRQTAFDHGLMSHIFAAVAEEKGRRQVQKGLFGSGDEEPQPLL
jgi:hypothetical protein